MFYHSPKRTETRTRTKMSPCQRQKCLILQRASPHLDFQPPAYWDNICKKSIFHKSHRELNMLEWVLSHSKTGIFPCAHRCCPDFLNLLEMPPTLIISEISSSRQFWNDLANLQGEACNSSSNDVYHTVLKLSAYFCLSLQTVSCLSVDAVLLLCPLSTYLSVWCVPRCQ